MQENKKYNKLANLSFLIHNLFSISRFLKGLYKLDSK